MRGAAPSCLKQRATRASSDRPANHPLMETIAFYGAGMLGSGFVRAMRRRGLAVNVWNRTP